MKKLLYITVGLLISAYTGYGQRYLSYVFLGVDSTVNIQYGNAVNYQNVNQNLTLDFYQPQGDVVNKRPLIIYIHGGGFQINQGDKTLPHIKSFCRNFAKKGYVCASIDYRLDTTTSGPGLYTAGMRAMHDARAAVRFFRKYAAAYKIDTTNIFIGGESAGAVTSMLVSYVDNINEIYPGTVTPYTVEGSSGNAGFSSNVKACLGLCGFMWDTTYIDASTDPKLLLMHGTSDPLIDWHQSLNIYTRAQNVGLQNTFKLLNGATHCPWYYGLTNSLQYFDTLETFTALFLYQHNSAAGIDEVIKQANKEVYLFYTSGNSVLIKPEDAHLQINALELYDILGRLLIKKQINASHTVLANEWSSGIYLLKIITDKGIYTKKILFEGN